MASVTTTEILLPDGKWYLTQTGIDSVVWDPLEEDYVEPGFSISVVRSAGTPKGKTKTAKAVITGPVSSVLAVRRIETVETDTLSED